MTSFFFIKSTWPFRFTTIDVFDPDLSRAGLQAQPQVGSSLDSSSSGSTAVRPGCLRFRGGGQPNIQTICWRGSLESMALTL